MYVIVIWFLDYYEVKKHRTQKHTKHTKHTICVFERVFKLLYVFLIYVQEDQKTAGCL